MVIILVKKRTKRSFWLGVYTDEFDYMFVFAIVYIKVSYLSRETESTFSTVEEK